MTERLKVKNLLLLKFGPYCYACGTKTFQLDLHELIARSNTFTEEGRDISYQAELCVLLCDNCHERLQHDRVANKSLFVYNCWRYGYDVVKEKLESLSLAEERDMSFDFPTKEEYEQLI